MHESRSLELKTSRQGRYEMNMAEWPVFLVGKTNQPDNLVATVREEIPHPGNGKPVVREVSVRASKDHGYPTERDGDVLVALITMSKRQSDFGSRVVTFTREEMRSMVGWPANKQSYDDIVKALYRWMHTKLEFRNAWYRPGAGPDRGSWADADVFIIQDIVWERPEYRKRYPVIAVQFGNRFFDSLAAGFIRGLDLDMYYSLRKTAKHMYLFLLKRFGGRNGDPVFRGDLRKFAVTNMALSPDYNIGQIKKKLRPSLEQLEAAGFLLPQADDDRYVKVGVGRWDIVLRSATVEVKAVPAPGPPRSQVQPTALPSPAPARELPGLEFPDPPNMGELLELMRSRGMEDEETMEELTRQYTDNVKPMVDLFDIMVKVRHKVDGEVVGPGYLARMIKKPRKMPEPVRRRWEELKVAEVAIATTHGGGAASAPAASRSAEERVKAKFDSLSPEERRGLEAWARKTYADVLEAKERETANWGKGSRDPFLATILRQAMENGIRGELGLPLVPMD